MYDKSAKSLRWLANQFPAVETPKDDTDRISTCIHLYCAAGADAIDTLTAQLAALQSENGSKDKEIERLKSELLEAREDYMASEMEREQGVAALSRVEAERDAARQDCAVAEENHRRAVAERDQIAGWVDLFCEMIEESFGRPTSETGGARAALAEIGWRGAQVEG